MKKNLPLIVGLGLPVAFVIALFAFVAIPSFFGKKPTIDFAFSVQTVAQAYGDVPSCVYSVKDNKITRRYVVSPYKDAEIVDPALRECTEFNSPQIYVYSTEQKSLRAATFEEAEALSFDVGPTSQDGFIVRQKNDNYGPLSIFESSNTQPVIELVRNGRTQETVDIPNSESYYYGDRFSFIGWINR